MPLDRFSVPTSRLAVVRQSMPNQEMLRIARRRRSAVLFVQDERRELLGYVHVIDLHLAQHQKLKPILRISRRESTIAALGQLQQNGEPYAAVIGDNGRILGIVDARKLAESILNSGRASGIVL